MDEGSGPFQGDGYVLWNAGIVASGARIQKTHFSADLGALLSFAYGDGFLAPVVNLAWRF